jgi:glycosyltransferase involved in cell wall biosynthesis
LKSADLLLANSTFLRERQARAVGLPVAIHYPEILPHLTLVPKNSAIGGQYVAGICGYAYKGAEVFFALASRFPSTSFLLVGDVAPHYLERIRSILNIRLVAWAPPQRFLSMTRVMLVPSRWPEPFGRIAVEAMGSGIPTLVSATGGLSEIAGGSRVHLVRSFLSVDAWASRLERLLSDDGARQRNIDSGLRLSARWLSDRPTRRLERRLQALAGRTTTKADRRPLVALLGSAEETTAFAMINAHWSDRLIARGVVRVANRADSNLFQDVTIHHDLTHRFGQHPLPESGHLVAVRTWDFGPFPREWIRTLLDRYDELWVHSRWIRQLAVRSGLPAARVRVIPLGCDPDVFRPGGPRFRVPTRKTKVFLFVGAPVLRKGIDILLRAWRAAFTRKDDVCLVVKANPADVFYQGIDWREEIRRQAADQAGAEIVLIDQLMSSSRLARLYRAAHAAVFPYRAEGFGLPILEAMACGCPPIVPRFGACLDYSDEQSAHVVRARRIQLPVNRRFTFNTLGFEEEVQEVDFCETSADALAETLVSVARLTTGERARIARASVARAARCTWDASAKAIEDAVLELSNSGVPNRIKRERRMQADRARRLAVARNLYEQRT